MKLLIKEQHESAENSKICYICKEILKKKKKQKIKNVVKLEIIVIIQRNIEGLRIACAI